MTTAPGASPSSPTSTTWPRTWSDGRVPQRPLTAGSAADAHPLQPAAGALEPGVVVLRLTKERFADARVRQHQERLGAGHRVDGQLGHVFGREHLAERRVLRDVRIVLGVAT